MPAFPAVVALSSLNGTDGFKIIGAAAHDQSGFSAFNAGDLNGDGFDDLIVGAPYADANGNDAGASYVVFGKASGFSPTLALSGLNGTNGFQITGENAGDWYAFSVSSAGDVNHDGIDDLIVGASSADANGENSGASYVIFGKTSGFSPTLALSSLNGTNGFKIIGAQAFGSSGWSVSSAGDVNGDGIDDLIVGVPFEGPSLEGASYVVFGKASGFSPTLTLSSLNGANGFKITGENEFDQIAQSVSSAGDVNGDGIDDLIVGAGATSPNGNLSGASYVVFGKTSGFPATIAPSSLNGTNGFSIIGAAAGDESGAQVSKAGDVNGDHIGDLIISAPGAGASGECYVVFGRASGFSATLNLSSLNGANGFRVVGLDGNHACSAVSFAGDVNGDGFDDVIIGAGAGAAAGAGASYVVFGKAAFSPTIDVSKLDGTNGFKIPGEHLNDETGTSVSSAGDINGDGFDDLIVSAPGAGGASGTTYVIFGHATPSLNGPTDIKLSSSLVKEFAKTGTIVGKLSATDADIGDTFTFKLSDSAGGRFAISGSTLKVKNGLLLDYEQAKSDTIKVRVTDNQGHSYDETLKITIKDVNPEKVTGKSGNDTFKGGSGNDTLNGAGGNDKLTGGRGKDSLSGGAGSDDLTGGAGRDKLIGGTGNDDFVFNAVSDTGKTSSTRDVITDFTHGHDDIDLSAIDANGSARGNGKFKFLSHEGAAFTGVKGQLHWYHSGSKTIVEGDTNGDRKADFQIELTGHKTLTSADFVL